MYHQVETLKQRGNQLLQAQQYEAAEAAYQEGLQLDPDNTKLLLNLAQLRLQQADGTGALRCCEEVLAQQSEGGGLPRETLLKATLRWGLGPVVSV